MNLHSKNIRTMYLGGLLRQVKSMGILFFRVSPSFGQEESGFDWTPLFC